MTVDITRLPSTTSFDARSLMSRSRNDIVRGDAGVAREKMAPPVLSTLGDRPSEHD